MEETHLKQGYVQLYTGDGKGKTTAALGLALRAAGAGLRVYIGQFIKCRKTAEMEIIRRSLPEITMEQYGAGGFIRGRPTTKQLDAASTGLKKLGLAVLSDKFDLVVADEICTAVSLGLLPIVQVLDVIESRPTHVELVLTGGNAPQALIDKADLVTEMRKVRHYYDSGIKARKGIEE